MCIWFPTLSLALNFRLGFLREEYGSVSHKCNSDQKVVCLITSIEPSEQAEHTAHYYSGMSSGILVLQSDSHNNDIQAVPLLIAFGTFLVVVAITLLTILYRHQPQYAIFLREV